MPQATQELRDLMEKWFGDPVSDEGPIKFLEARGWRATRSGMWVPPVHHYVSSCYELECMLFLFQEWDYGGWEHWDGQVKCRCGMEQIEDHAIPIARPLD